LLAQLKPIDLDAETYNTFVGSQSSWNSARAYDSVLVKYYSGRYTMRTVDELIDSTVPPTGSGYENWNQLFVTTHYGDWPAPEIFVVNTTS
jgi:hypothetical protein